MLRRFTTDKTIETLNANSEVLGKMPPFSASDAGLRRLERYLRNLERNASALNLIVSFSIFSEFYVYNTGITMYLLGCPSYSLLSLC